MIAIDSSNLLRLNNIFHKALVNPQYDGTFTMVVHIGTLSQIRD